MAEISTKPYLIRAIYEWCCDNGYTPHLVVKAGGRARLPMAYVRNGEIVLNISPTATNGLQMGNDVIEFQARFNGVPEYVVVPVDNVLAIFARETGFVVPFNIGPAAGADTDASGAGSAGAEGGAAGGPADAGAQPARPGQEGQGTSQGGQAGGGASAPAGGGDVVDFRAARAARPGLKAVPKPGDKDTSDASRPADEEGPKGRGTQADPAKGGATEGASDKGRDRSSSGSSVSPVGDASAPTEGDTPEKDEGGTTRGPRKPASRTTSPRRKTPAATDGGAADTPDAPAKPKATRSRKSTASPVEADAAAPTSAGAPNQAGTSTPTGAPAPSGEDGKGAGTEKGRKARPGQQQAPAGTRAPVPGAPTTDGPPDTPPPTPPAGGRPRLVRIK